MRLPQRTERRAAALAAVLLLTGCARDRKADPLLDSVAADTTAELTLPDAASADGGPAVTTSGGDTALRAVAAPTTVPSAARRVTPPRAEDDDATSTGEARAPRLDPSAIAASRAAPAGTRVGVVADATLCLDIARPGVLVRAATDEPLLGGDQSVLAPAGTPVALVVSRVAAGRLELTARTIDLGGRSYPLAGDIALARLDTTHQTRKRRGVVAAVAGAAVGAAVGGAVGRDAGGALTGAAVGAAAGGVVGVATAPASICLPAGRSLTLVLASAFAPPDP